MAKTYEAISSYTVPSNTASVTLSSIPNTYTDLVLVANIQDSSGYGLIRFNGDGAATGLYSTTTLRGNGSAASSIRDSSTNQGTYEANTGQYVPNIYHLQNYANTSIYKTMLQRISDAGGWVRASVFLYRSTSAISSIAFTSNSGTITAGSTFTLYGIKSA